MVYGLATGRGVWRIRIDQELRKLHLGPAVTADIKKGKLGAVSACNKDGYNSYDKEHFSKKNSR
jgi:hypothetical protein